MKVLVANRGEIAVRLIEGCKQLGYHSTAIYADEDDCSIHVSMADNAVPLNESGVQGYLNSQKIVEICKEHKINIVLPGYGFLSENTEFARLLKEAGVVFAGPDAQTISEFGLKHRARELAEEAGVPLVPGTGKIHSVDEAASEAQRLGYPVMVKATAGGGGMGLVVCHGPDQLAEAVSSVRSRGASLFKDDGLFLERYVGNARHIEGQVFGNGRGDVLWLGERECSIQRRHQKVVEESPSPFVAKHPKLRDQLRAASTSLAKSIKYKSAGTIEFLVDDTNGEFYFLEMNTRLQVEHGVSELCYGVDIVQLMLLQAQAEVLGQEGLDVAVMESYSDLEPTGHAIEVRVYAENPAADYQPAPGLFTDAVFPEGPGIRVDTWLERGSVVTPHFDPLLAKIMIHKSTREDAIGDMRLVLASTYLHGPPTNLELLQSIIASSDMSSGNTLTSMLDSFPFEPYVMEFKDGGSHTTVQDFPGRINCQSGVPVSGPMDNVSFRIANMLVGNEEGKEGFELTYSGPTILFHQPAVIALCGAQMEISIDQQPVKMWTRHYVLKGSEVSIGSCTAMGCRAYLAILGGLPGVGKYLSSKSTTPALKWGGYQGRTIRSGDVLSLNRESSMQASSVSSYTLPASLIPSIADERPIYTLPGPYASDEFLTPKGRDSFYETSWKVALNSGRTGIRLEGPPPEWSRESGGEGGSHPSNVLGYGYPLGGVSFTGNSAVVFTPDSPLQSGFICLQTVISCELWRMGQLRAGDQVRFIQCSWKQARQLEAKYKDQLLRIKDAIRTGIDEAAGSECVRVDAPESSHLILHERGEAVGNAMNIPRFTIRQAGDRALLCDFGSQEFDLRVRLRVQQLVQSLRERPPRGINKISRPHTMSVLVIFDPDIINQGDTLAELVKLEGSFTYHSSFSSRTYHLPMVFDPEENKMATQKFMETQRPYAAYLPDNIDFIRRNNGLNSRQDVLHAVENTPFLILASSGYMGLPVMMTIDPRKRLTVPKTNPSRSSTPAGALGTGGNTTAIYPVDSPGGYMLWGLTIIGCPFDTFGSKPNFTPERPWLFEPFDQVIFTTVSRPEFDEINKKFQMGEYKISYEDSNFSLDEYDSLVERTKGEVAQIRERQRLGAASELVKENALLARWNAETGGSANKNTPKRQAALDGPEIDSKLIPVRASMNARLWKINVATGDIVEASATLLVLEAMKMEIPVVAPKFGSHKVISVFREIGEVVEPGDLLFALEPQT